MISTTSVSSRASAIREPIAVRSIRLRRSKEVAAAPNAGEAAFIDALPYPQCLSSHPRMPSSNQATPALQVPTQLLHELGEAKLALGTGCVLMSLGNWRADGEVVADIERQSLDQDVLVALQSLELA